MVCSATCLGLQSEQWDAADNETDVSLIIPLSDATYGIANIQNGMDT